MFKKESAVYWLLGLLLLSGLLLRAYDLGRQSYWLDEGYTVSATRAILEHGYPRLDSGIFYFKNILANYFTAGPVLLFGSAPWVYRLPSVIFGLGLILMAYLLAVALFKRRDLALLTAAFLTFSGWEIFWSRQARGYTALQFFYLLSLWLLVKLLTEFRLKTFLWFIATALATALVHDSGLIVLPAGLLLLAWRYRAELKKQIIHKWRRWLWLGLVLVAGLILIAQKAWSFIDLLIHKEIWTIGGYFGLLFFHYGFALVASFIGWLVLLIKKEALATQIFGVFYLGALLTTVSLTDFLEFRYVLFIFPLMIMLMIYTVHLALPTGIKSIWRWLLLATIIVVPHFRLLQFWPQSLPAFDPMIPHPDFQAAHQVIQAKLSDEDIVITPYIPVALAYLNRADYWLKLSFSGKPAELETHKNFPFDLYHKKPALASPADLSATMTGRHGFVVFDSLAFNRLGRDYWQLLNEQAELIFHQDDGRLNEIWVFEF